MHSTWQTGVANGRLGVSGEARFQISPEKWLLGNIKEGKVRFRLSRHLSEQIAIAQKL